MLCVSIGTWADSSGKIGSTNSTYSYNSTTKVLELNLVAANDLNTGKWVNNSEYRWDSNVPSECKDAGVIVINGVLGNNDAGALWLWCESTNYGNIIDFRGLTDYSNVTSMNLGNNNGRIVVIIPDDEEVSGSSSFKTKVGCQNSNMWGATAQINGEELNLYFGNSTGFANDMEKDKNTYHYFDNITTANFYNENGGGVTLDEQVRYGINSLNRNITTVNAEGAILDGATWEMMNSHITTLNLADMTMRNSAKLKIGHNNDSSWDNLSSLANLNLSGATAVDVDASNQQSVVSIDLTDANITGHVNVTGLDLMKLEITMSDAADVSKIIPQTDSSGDPIDYSSVVKTPSNDPVEITVAGNGISTATIQAAIDALEDAPEGATNKNVTILHVTGTLTKADLEYIMKNNLPKLKLLDLSGCDYASDVTANDIANALRKYENGSVNTDVAKGVALIIPTPASTNPATGTAEMATYQKAINYGNAGLTFGYYTDATKRKLHIYSDNYTGDIVNFAPVVENCGITFLPKYNADGSFQKYMKQNEDFGKDLTSASKLGMLPAESMDFTWVYYGADYCHYANLNAATHYIVVPQNSTDATYDFTAETAESEYQYNNNIWVVSTYKGTDSPFANKSCFKGDKFDFSSSGYNQTGNLTYIRRAGTLAGAAPYLSDLQKNAQRMVIAGNVGKTDLEAMNLVASKWIDMSKANLVETEVEGDNILASILHFSNPNVEYLALPDCGVVSEFVPATIKTNCHSLKGLGLYKEAAKNGDAAKENTLYYASWLAGSARTIVDMLPEAQNATGADARTGMKKYKMWGPLNFADICNDQGATDAQGHYTTNASTKVSNMYALLGGNSTTILSADLSMAWFPTQDDMSLSPASAYETMTEVELPRTNMTVIPARFMYNCQQVSHIGIPDIYTTIKEDAFNLCTRLSQIDVYDVCAKDNNEKDLENVTYNAPVSPYSYKASQHHALIKEVVTNGPQSVTLPASLGHNEGEGLYARSMHINEGIRDVYILATTAPRCQKDAFTTVSYCGNNTYAGPTSHPFGREQYHMGAATLKPEEIEKWIAVLHFPVECTAAERANYTDVTREYSLPDETGEVDGDGKPIMWPTQTEFLRSYNQARFGAIWDAWKQNPDRDAQNELTRYGTDYLSDFSSWGNNPGFNEIYTGWHQFVLAANWMYIPEEEEEGEMDYTKTDWYTFCIPFNMTKKQVVELMGVRASTDKFTRTLDGTTTVTDDLMPEIRTLTGVTRYPNKQILLHISQDIATKENDINVGLREASYNASRAYGKDEAGNTLTGDENQIYIKGGYPYLVKAYVPTEMADKVKNLGGFVLARGEFFQSNVGNKYSTTSDGDLQAPYELKVQALAHVGNEEYPIDKDGKKDEMDAGANEDAYIYTFVGQYWEQPLPLYSYYLGNSSKGKNFFRATAAAEGSDKWSKWTWNPYVAIITANGTNEIKQPIKGQNGYTQSLSMKFDANDDSFGAAGAKYAFVFDDGISEFDQLETTAINKLDGQEIMPLKMKVYNANGQYVGSSVEGLAKGLYIVNGKKFLVK